MSSTDVSAKAFIATAPEFFRIENSFSTENVGPATNRQTTLYNWPHHLFLAAADQALLNSSEYRGRHLLWQSHQAATAAPADDPLLPELLAQWSQA
jgi:hypothetical protein